MSRRILRPLLVLAMLSTAFVAGVSVSVLADGNPATDGVPRVIPYQGVLELDGQPFNGEVSIGFSIYAASSGGAPLWSEERTVSVYNGTFAVSLGSITPIAATLLAADSLWVGITVDGLEMTNRQNITPVPYALWSAQSSDLTVARDASIARNLSVVGTATFGNTVNVGGRLTATSGLTVLGVLNLPSQSITSAMIADLGVGTADLANDAVTSAKIPDGTITSADIADSTIVGADILDGTITSNDIANNTVSRDDVLGTEVAVYEITNGFCPNQGALTVASTCTRSVDFCTGGLGVPTGLRNCSNGCTSGAGTPSPPCANTSRGFLLSP